MSQLGEKTRFSVANTNMAYLSMVKSTAMYNALKVYECCCIGNVAM